MLRQRRTIRAEENDVQILAESIENTSSKCTRFFKLCMLFMVMLYIFLPIVLIMVPQILEQVVFMNLYLGNKEQEMLKTPTASWRLQGVANFRINFDDVELGIWHVLPKGKISHYGEDNVAGLDEIKSELAEADNLIIYHHGSGGSRATGDHEQRHKLYRILQEEGYHVIAFEYRGYGDSTGWPSEAGLVNDSIAVFKWVKERTKASATVTFWGHSLGAAIVTQSASRINRECSSEHKSAFTIACPGPDAIILESGFSNVRKGAYDSPVARALMNVYPKSIFDYALETSLLAQRIELATDRYISDVQCPIMILHADDDNIITSKNADDLYKVCQKDTRHGKGKVKLIKFDKAHGYNHMDIYKAPQLPQLLKHLLEDKNDEPRFQSMIL